MSDQKKGQLHEVLAVEGSLKGAEDKILKEASKAFREGKHLFNGHTKEYQPANSEDTEIYDPEIKEVITNVPDKLEYIQESVIAAMDCMYQKEFTNTVAKADIVIDGVVISTGIPATVLLNLESKLKKVRDVYDVIPTLDSEKSWTKDENSNHTYITSKVRTVKTKKKERGIVLYDATEHHPAQTKMISEDVHQGHWELVNRSGCMSARDKHNVLKRLDNLIRGVVKARCKANQEEVKSVEVGKELFKYINGVLD